MIDEMQKFIEMNPAVSIDMLARYVERKGVAGLKCPKCDSYRNIMVNGIIGNTCGKAACHHMFGKKRPAHSAKMKELAAAGLNAGNFKKGRTNTFINSTAWKYKVLHNAKIKIPNDLTDDEFNTFFNQYKSTIKKSALCKRTFIKTMYERYKDEFDLDEIDPNKIDAYSYDELRRCERLLNSLKTLDANKNGTGIAKRFIRTRFENLKWCANKDSFTTRSSYETNYVSFFEDNGIKYSYEPYYIRCKDGFYLPDFEFEFENNTYLLEVKGYLINEATYISDKISYAIDHCAQQNKHMLLSYDVQPISMRSLITKKVTDKWQK